MYENFDELFKVIVNKTKNMTMFQTGCFLHGIYKEYQYMIGLNGYDEDTFFSLVHFKDVKLAEYVKRLKLDGEGVLEKYNKGVLYGVKNGIRYYNHFKRDNDGLWSFSWYEEKPISYETIRDKVFELLLDNAKIRLQKLTSIEAPQIIVDKQRELIVKLQNEELDIYGDVSVLDEYFESIKSVKGNGGKVYYIINNRINFFPNAKYGMYIKRR